MRPISLELEGFASFRQPTTIDFTDADLFVLSGPTGAGKSSVIDAITFALFGVVARYDDKRAVEPVISKGRNEARVALRFTVGRDHYTAVRVVRRTSGGGASTKEARLERWHPDAPEDGRAIADRADEVTKVVTTILGMGYEHFTRTVVLPQGAFQEFLHARSSERTDLLVELLGLGVYEDIAKAARTRAATLQGRVEVLQGQLDGELAPVSDDDLSAAEALVTALSAGLERIDEARPELTEIHQRGREQAAALGRLREQLEALAAIRVPDGVPELADRLDEAETALAAAREELAAAQDARERLDEEAEQVASPDAIAAQQQRLRDQAEALEARARTSASLAEVRARHEQATRDAAEAGAALGRATATLEEARRRDLVATLAADVGAGDPCPVCQRPLADEVHVDASAIRAAEQHRDDAAAALERDRRAAAEAGQAVARTETALQGAEERIAGLAAALADSALPDEPGPLDELAARARSVRDRRRQAREDAAKTQAALETATRRADELESERRRARSQLSQVRDTVAALGPPQLGDLELVDAWQSLATWAAHRREQLDEEVAEVEAEVTASRHRYTSRMNTLREELADLDVDLAGVNQPDPMRDRVAEARASAVQARKELQARREHRAALTAELADSRRAAVTAQSLGRLLDKGHFQRWLLARALRRLVAGATRHLQDLTDGAYSLRLEDRGEFSIVDHDNGGEQRPVRTLSGGETFLASLSLALAMSEHVADLAEGGAAKLESLFIDEGFGTLDAATIDVVRTALEELGATGRMVGVVTHVQALAEQLPVQFRVTKQSQTSVVDRVEV